MLEAVATAVIDVFCGITGHGVMWVLTLGWWKPMERRNDVASVIGIVFWVVVAVSTWLLFFR